MDVMKYTEKDYAIWGAGRIGEAAYIYFRRYLNVIFYVDNDERKWGETLNGLKIYSPNILENTKIKVIVALKNGVEYITQRLENYYHITEYTVFGFYQKNCTQSIISERQEDLETNSVIVSCSDGLGNQMFQYALYRNLQSRGKNVYFDISSYEAPGPNQFMLKKVFPAIPLKICSNIQRERYLASNVKDFFDLRNFQVYIEPEPREERIKCRNDNILHIENGVIKGYHQCFQYANEIRSDLINAFVFQELKETALEEITGKIKGTYSVSVHVRRGDYLAQNAAIVYGNICTIDYYRQAINYIKRNNKNAVFYFFSDDILWVRENINMKNAVYINSSMFSKYEDWYDMYLMSLCKNNIIANSTFSWWGAWLNQNEDKIVIAPATWMNGCDYQDICPEDWIRL